MRGKSTHCFLRFFFWYLFGIEHYIVVYILCINAESSVIYADSMIWPKARWDYILVFYIWDRAPLEICRWSVIWSHYVIISFIFCISRHSNVVLYYFTCYLKSYLINSRHNVIYKIKISIFYICIELYHIYKFQGRYKNNWYVLISL